jgi:hypothetical protein
MENFRLFGSILSRSLQVWEKQDSYLMEDDQITCFPLDQKIEYLIGYKENEGFHPTNYLKLEIKISNLTTYLKSKVCFLASDYMKVT